MSFESDTPRDTNQLRRDAVGLMQIICFVIAAAGPLAATVGASPAAFAFGNGIGVPAVYVLVGAMYIIFSVGYTAMSRHVSNTGAFYAYVTLGLGRPMGVGAAFVAVLTYTTVQCAIYGLFGFMVNQLLKSHYGIDVPWWALALGVMLVVHLCGARNVDFSGKLLAVLMVLELATLLLMDAAVIGSGGGSTGFSAAPFELKHLTEPGLGISIIFAVTCFLGFEATAIFSEEARDPKRTIPRATYATVIVITIVYALSTWALVQAYGTDGVVAAAKNDPANFVFNVNTKLVGGWSTDIMNVLLVTSLFAALLSFHNTINRYFYSLGRESLLWQGLAKTHPVHNSPYVAGRVQTATAAGIVALFALFNQDPFAILYSWMSTISTIGILAVQFMVAVAIVGFFWKKPTAASAWHRLIAPIISAVGLAICLVLVLQNLPLLSGSESPVVASLPYVVFLTWVAGMGVALWVRRSKPEVYFRIGQAT
ncbi:APC family permease [Archangium sp.]|uniref:APC family permease n=1 Tax=Archangium sp. TaxID=1872627 RepID=UPI002D5D59A9|nr:APC family permease [Archangium sp.]HYO59609.1 APC family permease [Archangium sp.]